MAMFIRAKRVTDPLDEKVKARLRGDDHCVMTGYSSSGSEHEAADQSCFSGLVHAFFEGGDTASIPASAVTDDGGDSGDDVGDTSAHAAEVVELLDPKGNPFRLRLLADASGAAEALSMLRSSRPGFRRGVMARLREAGYNAGICKARWETRGKLTAGSYEYIDVVVEAEGEKEAWRYIVDVEFSAEFEVARATQEYGRVAAALPRVVVAREEEVRQVVRLLAEAARRSLRSRGLSVPPWRKSRYMLAKWLGPYRRTVNPLPSSAGAAVAGGGEVMCRAVGFRGAPGLVVPPAAGTK